MTLDSKFDRIRPYAGEEIQLAVDRLCHNKEFLETMSFLSKVEPQQMINSLEKVTTRDQFQTLFFQDLIAAIIKHTSDGVSIEGLEYLDPDCSYLFISNHRDIILDSAILNRLLTKHGFKYTQAAIGNNLFVNTWVTDLVKLNSCFVIERNIPVKEMIKSSALRSEYIRELINESKNSVWIAQKEGRTKNGNDRTQPSLLKMLNMSGDSDFATNFKKLRIVPVAISYEWEACDDLKTKESYIKSVSEYIKTPDDDMNSMRNGLFGYKGRISFVLSKPLDHELDPIASLPSNGARAETLARQIDKIIHRNFKLWPNNYIAYDLLYSENKFSNCYTEEEKENFIRTMYQKLDKIEGNKSMLNNFFLEIYANPVVNHIKSK